jgi:hypothetical protein
MPQDKGLEQAVIDLSLAMPWSGSSSTSSMDSQTQCDYWPDRPAGRMC